MKTETAVKYFGSKTKVAEVLNVSGSAVTRWGEVVPELRALQLERITSNPTHPAYRSDMDRLVAYERGDQYQGTKRGVAKRRRK